MLNVLSQQGRETVRFKLHLAVVDEEAVNSGHYLRDPKKLLQRARGNGRQQF